MADDETRKKYGIDELLRRISDDRGEFFQGFVPWPEDLDNWRRATREPLPEPGERSLLRTVWEDPRDRESRILIDVTECASAADAVEALADRLAANQLARLPEGPPDLGVASFMHPEQAPPAVFFARGNVSAMVSSFGRKPAPVLAVAGRIAARLSERPYGEAHGLPLEAEPPRAKPGEQIELRYRPPIRLGDEAFLKFFISGADMVRREGRLLLRPKAPGRLEVEAFLVEAGREPFSGTLSVVVE